MSANGGQLAWTGDGERFGETLNGGVRAARKSPLGPFWSMQRDAMCFNRQCLADSPT